MKRFCVMLLLCNFLVAQATQLSLMTMKEQGGALSSHVLKKYIELFKVNTFAETGTWYGDTLAGASKLFDQLYSVEIAHQPYQSSLQRFRGDVKVALQQGESNEFIRRVAPLVNDEKTLFWLDAHLCGGPSGGARMPIPLFKEVWAIYKSGIKPKVILMDDIRGFYWDRSPMKTLTDLKDVIKKIDEKYTFAIVGDMALAFLDEQVELSPVIQAMTLSRLFDDRLDGDPYEVLSAEYTIAQAQGEERRALLGLRFPEAGYYNLWQGLICLDEGRYRQAYDQFETAIKNGCHFQGVPFWRVLFYKGIAAYHSERKAEARELFASVKSVLKDVDCIAFYDAYNVSHSDV